MDEFLEECKRLCKNFDKRLEKVFNQWESYNLLSNYNINAEPDDQQLQSFASNLITLQDNIKFDKIKIAEDCDTVDELLQNCSDIVKELETDTQSIEILFTECGYTKTISQNENGNDSAPGSFTMDFSDDCISDNNKS